MIKALKVKILILFSLVTVLSAASFQPAFAATNSRYSVTFTASGVNFLGSGPDTMYQIYYTVIFNGVSYSAPIDKSITVNVPAGTYSWSAPKVENTEPCTECPTFWQASPSSGKISVGGAAKSARVSLNYLDKVLVSIWVPVNNGSSDGYPVKSVSTDPALQNVTIKPGQYWQASGYLTYGTAIQVNLNVNAKMTAYSFDEWGGMMVCAVANRFTENTTLYASDNCQFQALFYPAGSF